MNSPASVTGIEYFSVVLIPSSKIAIAFHLMFSGKSVSALVKTGEKANTRSKIKEHSALLLKCFRNMIASSAEHLAHLCFGRSRQRSVVESCSAGYGASGGVKMHQNRRDKNV